MAGSYLLFMVLMRHFFALQINGAVRWIGVGGFIVSLSLMSWLFLPLYGAVLYRYRGEGYGAVLKAIVWMLLIAGILITCPDLVMAGTVGLSCVFMLMLALEKGWYQVAVTKVMTGIGISVVGVPVGILAYFFFFGAEYQKSRILAMFAVNKSQMMEGTTLGAVRELLSKCMAVGRATGVEDFWTGDRISSADYMMLGIAGYCGILVMVLCIAIIAGLLCWFLRSALKRKMVQAVLEMSEYNRFSKGIFGWVGFRTKWLQYDNVERSAGKTKWSMWKLFKYSVEGITGFSVAPLSLASVVGVLFCLLSFIMIAVIIVRTLVWGDPVSGWPSLACIIFMVSGVQLLCTGIVGEYLSKTYLETKKRPIFILKDSSDDKEQKHERA